ncbi:DUF1501 domain-containing protein [Brevibacillus dissolubilis]|uniref:DUF1501 domain-containing protein n=1 Tax=Brevibacillus dissolubilis TaxID=1844116 RepID=UPI0011177E63|nr:DUF1501 domain-containing protein [Brevibacillus dissolubilis]
MTTISRREFIIRSGALLLGLGMGETLISALTSPNVAHAANRPTNAPKLVVVQLTGGNDGLNTIIPYTNGVYYDNRPRIAVKQNQVLAINKQLGFHASMPGINTLYQQGKVGIIQGVGYPNPDLSHFRSMDIWHSGDPVTPKKQGWLARYLQQTQGSADQPVRAIEIGQRLSHALNGQVHVPCIQNVGSYKVEKDEQMLKSLRKLYQIKPGDAFTDVKTRGNSLFVSTDRISTLTPQDLGYPSTPFGRDLATAAAIIKGGLDTQIIYTQMNGYDEHASENSSHPKLLSQLDQAISFFYHDLAQNKLADNVVIMMFSEFGRRLKENSSVGTDHGTSGPVFLIGNPVKGGLHGEHPSLAKLVNGDLPYTVDFRSVYATVIDKWLGGAHQDILGKRFEVLPVFR